MKKLFTILLLLQLLSIVQAQPRQRLIVLSDFFKDPDDKQSLIRLLCYANEFELQGLIATSLAFGDGTVHPEWIKDLLNEYGKVQPNLQKHARPEFPYPSAESLKAIVHAGAPVIRKYAGRGKGFVVPYPPDARDARSCEPAENWIGPEKDTPASEHIIQVLDQEDSRPVWITVWGGSMDLAQALWKVRHERSPKEVSNFVSKIRLFQISWQDTGAVWIWNNFPELFFILCFESHRGMYDEGPVSKRDELWVNQNLRQDHGPLGAAYPKANTPGIKEGDSPSFLHLLAAGLNDPGHPEWGGWGGRYRRLNNSRNAYVDAFDQHPNSTEESRKIRWAVGRWIKASNNDFAARMDACIGDFNSVNHNPVAALNGDVSKKVLHQTVHSGESVEMDATGSSDPDGDSLNYLWWQYRESGTLQSNVRINNSNSTNPRLTAPRVQIPETLHIILEITDNGTPPLTSYRRLILEILPE